MEPSGCSPGSICARRSASHAPPEWMPTSLASNAAAPRSLSASRPSVISASGSETSVKVVLQDDLGSDRIAHGIPVSRPGGCVAQRRGGGPRREALVAEGNGQREPTLELAREAAGP